MKVFNALLAVSVTCGILASSAVAQYGQQSADHFQTTAEVPAVLTGTGGESDKSAVQTEYPACGCDDACGESCGIDWMLPCNRCPGDEPWFLFNQETCSGWKFYGWIDQGVTTNPYNPVNPPQGTGNLPVTFNYRNDEYQLNQAYGVVEKVADGSCGVGFGGRVDLLYGEDYIFTQAVGLETRDDGTNHWNISGGGGGINGCGRLGLAMPQIYGEVAYGDLSVKLGHFYTIIGYESVMAPANFFYSHAYTMQYGEPFTHTGGLAEWKYSDTTTLYGGLVNGWDKFDAESDRVSVIGGITYTPCHERYSVTLTGISGDEDGSTGTFAGNRSMYSLVFDYHVTDRLEYVLQHDYGFGNNAAAMGEDAQWYGLNQYLFYTLNDCWKAGLRVEWFRDDDGTRVVNGFNPANRPGEWYEITAGLNWSPHPNVTVRPEARWDWIQSSFAGGGAGGPFDIADFPGRTNQFTAAVDVIVTW